MTTQIKPKLILVTGASRGIGRAIVEQMGQQDDCRIVGTATTEAGAEKITAYMQAQGIKGKGFAFNLTQHDTIPGFLSSIQDEFGCMPNVLINNAGIRQDNIMLRMKPEEWDNVVHTNLTSTFRLTQACVKPMLREKWGRIIFVSSVVARTGNLGQANYVASKAGIEGLSKVIALEFAHKGITVNSVAPGFIATDMTETLSDQQKETIRAQIPKRRMGCPTEVAATVDFLASDKASYITAQTIYVDGGMCRT